MLSAAACATASLWALIAAALLFRDVFHRVVGVAQYQRLDGGRFLAERVLHLLHNALERGFALGRVEVERAVGVRACHGSCLFRGGADVVHQLRGLPVDLLRRVGAKCIGFHRHELCRLAAHRLEFAVEVHDVRLQLLGVVRCRVGDQLARIFNRAAVGECQVVVCESQLALELVACFGDVGLQLVDVGDHGVARLIGVRLCRVDGLHELVAEFDCLLVRRVVRFEQDHRAHVVHVVAHLGLELLALLVECLRLEAKCLVDDVAQLAETVLDALVDEVLAGNVGREGAERAHEVDELVGRRLAGRQRMCCDVRLADKAGDLAGVVRADARARGRVERNDVAGIGGIAVIVVGRVSVELGHQAGCGRASRKPAAFRVPARRQTGAATAQPANRPYGGAKAG